MKALLIGMTYNLVLLAGAAYLVYWKGASAWVFALPLLMCYGGSARSK